MRTKTDVEVVEYARSLVAHNLYNNMEDATNESLRFFNKCDKGFVEPMKCPHRLGIEINVTTIDGKVVSVTHTLKERKIS